MSDAAYQLFVFDISYFSGKVEAYMRYKDIPHRRIEPSWKALYERILPATGAMQLPVVKTPEGLWLSDSTPMIDWFERRYTHASIMPQDPMQQFFCRLLEDYADEWLWRPALYYRWCFKKDADQVSDKILNSFLRDVPLPRTIKKFLLRRRQYANYIRGDGVSDETREHIESIYVRTLDQLNRVFLSNKFLLGDKPCLADFGFFASMYKHFSLDPTPATIMHSRAPLVADWVERMWQAKHEDYRHSQWIEPGRLPTAWDAILLSIGRSYMPYLAQNAKAWLDGSRYFDCACEHVIYRRLKVNRYRVWCRERLQQHFVALDSSAKPLVKAYLQKYGIWESLWLHSDSQSRWSDGGDPALARALQLSPLARLNCYLSGSPWYGGPRS